MFCYCYVWDKGKKEAKREIWTAAKESECAGKFEWCSNKLFFSLHEDLSWRKKLIPRNIDSCAFVDFAGIEGKLGKGNCFSEMRIICEVGLFQSN